MSYVDLNTIHNPATGTVAPATWGDQIRDNFEFLVDPPACNVFNSGSDSVANVTTVALSADSEQFDNNAMHSTVTNNSRITIQTAGRYLLLSAVTFANDVDGNARITRFRQDGTTEFAENIMPPLQGANPTYVRSVTVAPFTVGNYVEVVARHDAGNNLAVQLTGFAVYYLTR